MNRKGNVVVVILMVILVMGLSVLLITYSPAKQVFRDQTRQAALESSLALRKSVFVGVGKSMESGLSAADKTWFCNRPIPPSYSEANISLMNSTSFLLDSYFGGYRKLGYQASFSDIRYNIAFPLNATATVRIPGYSVLITDLSGSMSFLMNGRRRDAVVRDMNKLLVDTTFNLTPGAKIGLVTYEFGGNKLHPITDDKNSLYAAIDTMIAPEVGGTCIACGIYRAVEMLVPPPVPGQYVQERPISIVLMSDGGANYCFDQSSIKRDCLVLDYQVGSSACTREQAKQQAIEYARQANALYGINVYTLIFGGTTEECTSRGIPESDCYDPVTMRRIAEAAGNASNYAEGWDQDALAQIYQRYGNAVARYLIRNMTYLKLENDRVDASIENASSGLNHTNLKTRWNISDNIVWDFRTWWMYKNLVTWNLRFGQELLELPEIKDALTSYKPCKAVFYSENGCPPRGEVYGAYNTTFDRMLLKNSDMRPLNLIRSIENSLIQQLNETNISCEVEFIYLNVTNHPVFDFRPSPPANFRLNMPFGNGSYRQSSYDSVNLRQECPATGPGEREDFLISPNRYRLGIIGPNKPVNEVCSPATPYQYTGIDHAYKIEFLVRCEDPTIGAITDGKTNFAPLTLEFIMKIDMMSDCDPPDDMVEDTLMC